MVIAKDATIIGLTGSFGSGCSTIRKILESHGYFGISLSDPVHQEWEQANKERRVEEQKRSELQDIGNKLRRDSGNNAILAEMVIQKLQIEKSEISKIVIDSIRHPDEILALRDQSRNSFIVSVISASSNRWARLENDYEKKGLLEKDFSIDDSRDAYEDSSYGQKVQLCSDNADIAFQNSIDYPIEHKRNEELWKKLGPLIERVTGDDIQPPSHEEAMMALAYTAALSSYCYKRQVGAVICDNQGVVLGVGCNNNPYPLESCYDQWGECFRDTYKTKLFDSLKTTKCPDCGENLEGHISPDYKCNCGFDLDAFYIKDKALSRCSALHAEESAIINVGAKNLKGCTIYTTTFPCLLCAKKIVGSGITKVVYCEPYPDRDGAVYFQNANDGYKKRGEAEIKVYNFEGIKARAYFKVFSAWRKAKEEAINSKRGV